MTFEQFMARLEVVYGPPKTNDLAAFVEIYREMIGNFTADVYSRGFKLVAARHTHKSWPIPKLCLDALKDAARELETGERSVEHRRLEAGGLESHKPHGLLRGPIAETADREGWILGLNEFLHKNGRLPKAHEITRIKETARFVDRCSATEGTSMLDGVIADLANSIMKRRKALGAKFDGERS